MSGGWEADEVGVGGGWGAKGGVVPYIGTKRYSFFIEVCKQPQFTCQVETVADSSLTPIVAQLVCPRGTVYFIVDYHKFTRLQKDASESRPWYL